MNLTDEVVYPNDVLMEGEITCEVAAATMDEWKKCSLCGLRDEPVVPMNLRCGQHRFKFCKCHMKRLSVGLTDLYSPPMGL